MRRAFAAITVAATLALGCAAGHAATATPVLPSYGRFEPLVEYLRSQVDSAFPGATIVVGRRDTVILQAAVGHIGVDDARPARIETVYDLASLTKVVGLTSAVMMLVDEGRLDLDAPVQRFVPAFQGPGKERVTIRHLLTHSSGLPAWRPLYAETATREQALALVDTTPLLRQPGDTFVYSDLGAIVLTQAVEAITRQRLDSVLEQRLFARLQMYATRFVPPARWRMQIAPTENDTVFRHRALRGEVHDENAGRLGGISGHAGLFSSALDLATFARWLLSLRLGRALGCDAALCRPTIGDSTVRLFTRRQNIPPGSSRALGWDTPSENSSAGTKLGPNAFGHTGFTGTSIWLDPDRDLFIILLTNRVNPTRANTKILQVRRRVADLVVDALTPRQ
jgi:CubicO group peptidase (beta-lactamase class C family)